MAKNVMALCGLVALVGGLGVWQFGFFSDVKEQLERETAVTRAQSIVASMEQRAESLTDRARELRIKARTQEKEVERDEAQTAKTQQAILTLAAAARERGLPKPSAASEADRQQTIAFAGRTLTADEVYETLRKWQKAAQTAEDRLKIPRAMIERMRTTADQLEQKQSQFVVQVQATRATLERLEMQRDLAALDAELAELGASASGNPAGELENVLDTLQKQIDEYESTSEVLAAEPATGEPLSLDEVLATTSAEPSIHDTLDALWDKK
jgi:chromosome segregation ATPase